MHIETIPKVSVIIPLFNLKQYVGEAIDSILDQTYQNIEIIVVDDGSTDNPETVLSKYRDRIKVIRQQNKGLASARNTGIRNSDGKYLVFLDADDYVSTDKLQMEVKVLEKAHKTGWVYEGSLTLDNNARIIRKLPDEAIEPPGKPPQGKIFHRLIQKNLMPVNAVMIRKEVIDVGVFDESLTSYEDWDFWLRVSAKYEVKYIDKPLAFVRFRPDSMQRDRLRFYSNKIRVLNRICRSHPELTRIHRRKINRVVAEAHYYLGIEYRNEDKVEQSASEFLKAIRAYPLQRRVYSDLTLAILKLLRISIQ